MVANFSGGQLTFGPFVFQSGPLYRLDLSSGALASLRDHPANGDIVSLLRAPDGRLVSIISENKDNRSHLVVFDTASGTELARYDTSPRPVDPFAPKRAFYRDDGTLVLMTLPELKYAPARFDSRTLKWSSAPRILDTAVSADGKKVFGTLIEFKGIPVFTQRTLKFGLVDLATGKKVLERPSGIPIAEVPTPGDAKATGLAIKEKADGTMLAAFRLRNRVYIFDSANESKIVLDLPEGDYSNLAIEIGKGGRTFFFADRVTTKAPPQMAVAELNGGGVQFFSMPSGSRSVATLSTPDGRVLRLYESPAKLWLSQVFGPPI